MSSVCSRATNELLRSLILLGATAVITGLGVPIVLRRVDESRDERQKNKEARLARQQKVIEAQSKLLDDLSELLWRWRYLSIRIAYYGLLGDAEDYGRAEDEYDRQVWDVFDGVRVQISRARRLASEEAYNVLLRFYEEQLVELDKELMRARDTAPDNRRAVYFELNKRIMSDTSTQIDNVLHEIAHVVGLSESDVPTSRERVNDGRQSRDQSVA